jgi:hypothetical protein
MSSSYHDTRLTLRGGDRLLTLKVILNPYEGWGSRAPLGGPPGREPNPLLQPLAPSEPPEATPQNLTPHDVNREAGSFDQDRTESLSPPSWAGTGTRVYMGGGGLADRRPALACGAAFGAALGTLPGFIGPSVVSPNGFDCDDE